MGGPKTSMGGLELLVCVRQLANAQVIQPEYSQMGYFTQSAPRMGTIPRVHDRHQERLMANPNLDSSRESRTAGNLIPAGSRVLIAHRWNQPTCERSFLEESRLWAYVF